MKIILEILVILLIIGIVSIVIGFFKRLITNPKSTLIEVVTTREQLAILAGIVAGLIYFFCN